MGPQRDKRVSNAKLDSREGIESFLKVLQNAVHDAFAPSQAILLSLISPAERRVLEFANSLQFEAGSWYRPFHNLVVTASMCGICLTSNAARDLVYAAILHDIGYSSLNLPHTTQGSSWNKEDVRLAHMRIGAQESERYLREQCTAGMLSLSDERLAKLIQIVATHDDPYLGRPLTDPEALLHRDADRCYVISCSSFWKDYTAHVADHLNSQSSSDAALVAAPDALLHRRYLSFFGDRVGTARDGVTCEPLVTSYAQEVIKGQYTRRLNESAHLMDLLASNDSPWDAVQQFLTRACIDDFKALCGGY